MNQDPTAWTKLGTALRNDRERQGLTRGDLVNLVKARGVSVTVRTISRLEKGVVPRRDSKPPSLEPVAAALGWPPGRVDAILEGRENPAGPPPRSEEPPQEPLAFSNPRYQAIWDLDLPLEEREQAIRDLMEAELRRAREQEEGDQTGQLDAG